MSIIYIFRRDLRTKDNKGLNEAIKKAKDENLQIILIFIFTIEQVKNNDYKSDASVHFMINSLKQIPNLFCFYGTNEMILKYLFKKKDLDVKYLFFNKDTSHYARQRDRMIENLCNEYEVECFMIEDYNLHPLESIRSSSDSYYTVYTPFYNKASQMNVDKPYTENFTNYFTNVINSKYLIKLDDAYTKFVSKKSNRYILKGGRSEGMALLLKTTIEQKEYEKTRNNASINTSLLSAHIKFGTLSIREVYYHFKKNAFSSLIGQLYWNEFYDLLMYNLPYSKTLGKSNFKDLKIKWKHNEKFFESWKSGNTGFPFIDAGMRQLNNEGWMHNRARMAVANFLSMVLHIDWRKGEKYFATKLIDYDVAQNNGNWQWSVGVGVDKTGYLRIFNPITQSKSHDPECEYIKKYIEELKNVPNEHIHKWDVHAKDYDIYAKPIVDYKEQRKTTLKLYSR